MKSTNEIHDMIMAGDLRDFRHLGDILLAMLDHIDSLRLDQPTAPFVVDYTKPHPFDFDKWSGREGERYEVCKRGMSKGNELHR